MFILSRCFFNGNGAGLGDPGCMRENFGIYKSLSILMANGTSFKFGSNFCVGFSTSCVAAITICYFAMYNTIAAFTAYFAALLSHSMNAATIVLLVGSFEKNHI